MRRDRYLVEVTRNRFLPGEACTVENVRTIVEKMPEIAAERGEVVSLDIRPVVGARHSQAKMLFNAKSDVSCAMFECALAKPGATVGPDYDPKRLARVRRKAYGLMLIKSVTHQIDIRKDADEARRLDLQQAFPRDFFNLFTYWVIRVEIRFFGGARLDAELLDEELRKVITEIQQLGWIRIMKRYLAEFWEYGEQIDWERVGEKSREYYILG